jgi:hypothetical protein
MNTKELAAIIEDELQNYVQISLKSTKADYAVFDIEDEAGNAYVLRLTHVKGTDEDADDDENVDVDLD